MWRVGLDGLVHAFPGTGATLDAVDLAAMPDGSVLVGDVTSQSDRVLEVRPDGGIVTVAGGGPPGTVGDGGPATSAHIEVGDGIAALPGGGFVIGDLVHHLVRRVASDGMISTLATGVFPTGLAARPDGSVLVVESLNDRVRRIALDGSVTSFAGTGRPGFSGDGGPARSARLSHPESVTVLTDGSIVIADSHNRRVRRVATDGTIQTVMGNGTDLLSGDGLYARDTEVAPGQIAATSDGGYVVWDNYWAGDRLRYVPGSGRAALLGLAVVWIEPASSGGDAFVDVTTTAAVRVTLSHGRRSVAVRAARVRRGGYLDLRHIGPPGPYRVAVTAATTDGRAAYQRTTAYLGDRLTSRWARRFALHWLRDGYSRNKRGRHAVAVGRCRRFTRWRVDCELLVGAPSSRPRRCVAVLSTRVYTNSLIDGWGDNDQVSGRQYRCLASPQRRFARRPRYGQEVYHHLDGLADAWET